MPEMETRSVLVCARLGDVQNLGLGGEEFGDEKR